MGSLTKLFGRSFLAEIDGFEQEFTPSQKKVIYEIVKAFAETLEKWILEDYSQVVEGWTTDELTPEIQSWVKEELKKIKKEAKSKKVTKNNNKQ